jgi:lysophospholipase L1-like esterase
MTRRRLLAGLGAALAVPAIPFPAAAAIPDAFAWGLRGLTPTYGGPLANIYRRDGAGVGVFPGTDREIDWSVVDDWRDGEPAQITRLYDQSGRGVHLQLTPYGNSGPSAPDFPSAGPRAACFDGSHTCLATPNLPRGFISNNNFCLCLVARINSVGEAGMLAAINGGEIPVYLPGDGRSTSAPPFFLQAGGHAGLLAPPDTLSVIVLNSGHGGMGLSVNEAQSYGPPFQGDDLINLFVGDAPPLDPTGYWLAADIHAVFLIPRALSPGQATAFRQSLYSSFCIDPYASRRQIVLIGDSITWSFEPQNQGWPRLLADSSTTKAHVRNLGIPGSTVGYWLLRPAILNSFAAALSGLSVTDQVCIGLGSNDLAGGHSAAQLSADIGALIGWMRHVNPRVPIFGATLLPRGSDSGFETQRLLFNNWLRAIPTGYCGVVDFGADPNMAQSGDPDLYYDAVHPTVQGCLHMAAVAENVLGR